MSTSEMNERYKDLYEYMANSSEPSNMKAFGNVMNEMMEWMIQNKPDAANEWIDKLDSIRWKNYLTQKEAERIVSNMIPKAPWSKDQWKSEMSRNDYSLEKEPNYNSCALWVTMNMIMSDSSSTLSKYANESEMFNLVYELAIDKLTDEDGVFLIRRYFNL